MTTLAVLVLLIILAGVVSGFMALMQLAGLKKQLAELQQQLQQFTATKPAVQTKSPSSTHNLQPTVIQSAALQSTELQSTKTREYKAVDVTPLLPVVPEQTQQQKSWQISVPTTASPFSSFSDWIEQQFIKRGMVWLGAVALALGGIFLVKHSVDSGWLSPALRVSCGAVFGILLLLGSEWLHQRSQGHQLTNYAPAALSSGGFISLYATVLVALDWYQLINPAFAFPLLALIALAASWLSLRQGPVLALIGIVGAYVVPVLVSTGSTQLIALLIYVSLVTCSSVLVEQRVKRPWLWYLPMTAHLLWLAVALQQADADQLPIVWLFICGSLLCLAWLPVTGFNFSRLMLQHTPLRSWWPFSRQLWLALVILLFALLALAIEPDPGLFCLVVFVLLLQGFAASHSKYELLLWCSALPALLWLLLHPLLLSDDLYSLNSSSQNQHILLIIVCSLPMLALIWRLPSRLHWSSALATIPALLLGAGYAQAASEIQQHVQLNWTLVALCLVVLQTVMALKIPDKAAAFILMAGANFALTLCFTFWLSDAALTLAIAAQLVLLTVLSHRMQIPVPYWLIKLLIAAILVRLTFAPILGQYQDSLLLGLHWSFVVYPFTLLCFALSWYLWSATALKGWLEGALLHLIAVFITVQTQYWLNAGTLDLLEMDFSSKTVHAFNWLLLALVYQWRSHKAAGLSRLYQLMAGALLTLSAITQLDLSLISSPFFQSQTLGQTPFFNLLCLLWGLPALVCALLSQQLRHPDLRRLTRYSAVAFALVFITAQIRHYWQQGQLLLSLPTFTAEQYSYSLVFLVLAISTVLLAQWRTKASWRKAGFVLLSVVVLKVFVVDLGHLTGVLRALSFIGLGLSLVLLGWLFQRLEKPQLA
jgi:uncharacterized membrane protein